MAFEETRLNDKGSYGFQGGPRFSTLITSLNTNGNERRSRRWVNPLWIYTAPYKNVTLEVFYELQSAHLALGGMFDGFRFKDWSDYRARMLVGQSRPTIGFGTGAEQELQLIKNYTFGSKTYSRPIKKPVDGTVILYADGTPITSSTNATTGIATFTATDGAVITADFDFDVPVRFDSDELPFTYEEWQAMSSNISLVELRNP